jgi:hypothetical protein
MVQDSSRALAEIVGSRHHEGKAIEAIQEAHAAVWPELRFP